MIRAQEIEKLREHIGPDGKLIIDDTLTEKQKERFQFINGLDIDLLAVLTRTNDAPEEVDDEVITSDDEDDESDDFEDEDDVFVDDEDDEDNEIQEDDEDDSIEELDNFF